MPLLVQVAQIVVLFASTLIIMFADGAYRRAHPPDGFPMAEPSVLQMIVLTVMCNIAALPFYFYQTRGKVVWALIGFVGFLLCMGVSVATGFVLAFVLAAAA